VYLPYTCFLHFVLFTGVERIVVFADPLIGYIFLAVNFFYLFVSVHVGLCLHFGFCPFFVLIRITFVNTLAA